MNFGFNACEPPMASTSTQSATSISFSSSSSSTTQPQKYDVFLSFRGETRRGYTDALYHAMKDVGIAVFRDSENLQFGEKITPALSDAIKESQFAVVVISPEFATSKACLFELTVIMKYRGIGHLNVFPIFYRVNPGELEKLMKDVDNTFTEAQDDPAAANEKLEYWKSLLDENDLPTYCKRVLREASNLRVEMVKEDSHETEVAKKFSFMIFSKLVENSKIISKPLVGINFPAATIMKLINIEEENVSHVIGICGMSGIGKSTLAEVIYDRISHRFTRCCFIEKIGKDIGNSYLVMLQKQLISCILGVDTTKQLITAHQVKGVLQKHLQGIRAFVVLDDVWHRSQVDALVESLHWFGRGSRIMITSQKRDLPHLCENNIYEVKELNENDALVLLCQRAFSQPQPKEGFERVTREIAKCTRCLPFALDAFGSHLSHHHEDLNYWESYQKEVGENLENNLFNTLKRALDDLVNRNPPEKVCHPKELFLDIACYFNKCLKNRISHILEALGYNPIIHLGVLEDYSLLKISNDGRLLMHDLYVNLGKQIAKNSRLLCKEDVIRVLRATTIRPDEYREVQGIVLELSYPIKEQFNLNPLSIMTNLRILWINCDVGSVINFYDYNDPEMDYFDTDDGHLADDDINDAMVEWDGQLPKLSSELRIMEWRRCPFKILLLDWKFTKLVELKLWCSRIEQLWVEQESFPVLKVIDMRYSKRLITTPNLSQVPNLEILNLSGCKYLHTVRGHLKRIKKLRLRGCHRLEQLPDEISSEFLEILDLFECSKLKRFPNVPDELPYLRYLQIDGTHIKELPFKSSSFPSLEEFSAYGTDIRELPYSIVSAGKLRTLSVSCYNSNTFKFPPSFSALSSLEILFLINCIQSNEAVPMGLGELYSLIYLDLSFNKFTKIPDCVYELPELDYLLLHGCTKLELSEIRFEDLTSLKTLDLSYCNLITIPESIGSRSFLISSLELANNSFTELPDTICELPQLGWLNLCGCTSLRVLPKLPLWLYHLRISNCHLSAAFHSQRIEQISPELLQTKFCASTVAYVGFDCKPHKILYLKKEFYNLDYIRPAVVACCPTQEPRTLPGFICGVIISNKKIEVRMDWKWEKNIYLVEPETCVLSIVYEVTGESSDSGARENNNRILPVFVCQLQLKETSAEQIPELASQSQHNEESPVSFFVRVPEVATVGSSYGVWVSMKIPDSMRRPKQEKRNISDSIGESEPVVSSIEEPKRKKRKISESSQESGPMIRGRYVASVTASNEKVKLKECGGHLLSWGECTRNFCKVASEFSRPTSDSNCLYRSLCMSLGVSGPIK